MFSKLSKTKCWEIIFILKKKYCSLVGLGDGSVSKALALKAQRT